MLIFETMHGCSMLQCVAVWCSVLQSVHIAFALNIYVCYIYIYIYILIYVDFRDYAWLQYVAVCFCVLRCGIVCCRVYVKSWR